MRSLDSARDDKGSGGKVETTVIDKKVTAGKCGGLFSFYVGRIAYLCSYELLKFYSYE